MVTVPRRCSTFFEIRRRMSGKLDFQPFKNPFHVLCPSASCSRRGLVLGETRQPFIVTYCHDLTEIIGDVVRLYHADNVGMRHILRKVAVQAYFESIKS